MVREQIMIDNFENRIWHTEEKVSKEEDLEALNLQIKAKKRKLENQLTFDQDEAVQA